MDALTPKLPNTKLKLEIQLIAGIVAEAAFLVMFWFMCDNARLFARDGSCFSTPSLGYAMLFYLFTGMWIPCFLYPLILVMRAQRLWNKYKPFDPAHWIMYGILLLLLIPVIYINFRLIGG